jgi:hypothetical protein
MNRRAFLGGTVAAFAAHTAAPILDRPSVRYGPMDVARHRLLKDSGVDLHVIRRATGEDVTSRCNFADDTGEGYAIVFRHNAAGRPYIDRPGHAAQDRIDGIEFRRVIA